MSTPEPAPPAETTRVVLARLEGKLDVIAVQLSALIRTQDDHEARLRALEARPAADSSDHEARLRTIEARPTVSPRQLAAALVTALGALATASPLLARIYGG